jgi:hypothetical protein
MRPREKLTVEEKVSIALELIKRERSLDEIREHYRVSHTTAYKLRNQFLEGGRRALSGGDHRHDEELEARVKAIEDRLARDDTGSFEEERSSRRGRGANLERGDHEQRSGG